MDPDIEDPLAERARLREALAALVDAAPDLGIPPAESAPWRSAAAELGDAVLVMLSGASGSGKTLLAGALGGAELGGGDTAQSDADTDPALILWKYGFEASDVVDGDVVERYRPSPALRDCEFVEVAPAAFGDGAELAERAYTMADILVLVFSADDPWGKAGWEFLRGIHKRRERPTAAVVTHAEGRTREELDAIVDFLGKTSRAAIAEEVPVFVVSSSSAVGSGQGVPELFQWIGEVASEQPASRARVDKGESVLLSAAETVSLSLRDTVDDTDAEADCVLWLDAEISREHNAASAEAAAAMAPAREIYQDLTSKDRRRLERSLGVGGLLGSLLRGGGWLRKAQAAASEAAARRAEEGARRAVSTTGDRLAALGRNLSERVAGVFGEKVAGDLPQTPEFGGAADAGRRAGARVREAAGDREAGVAVAGMLGARRMMLMTFVVVFVGLLAGGWYFLQRGQSAIALLCGSAALVLVLWAAVLLRAKKAIILAHYDRENARARETIGRDLGRVYEPEIERVFAEYSASLAPLRARAGGLAADRAGLRARVLQAIEHASTLRSNSVL